MIETIKGTDCLPKQTDAIITLFEEIWPFFAEFSREKQIEVFHSRNPFDMCHFVIWDGHQAVAHAGLFAREIYTMDGPIIIGALSGVCTTASQRGKGYASMIVNKAFESVKNGTYPVSLWMTEVEPFYEKLGARVVKNTWVNTQNAENPMENPWPDEEKMIYPASYPWPEGQIDLNGGPY